MFKLSSIICRPVHIAISFWIPTSDILVMTLTQSGDAFAGMKYKSDQSPHAVWGTRKPIAENVCNAVRTL